MELYDVVALAVVAGLVQAVKQTSALDHRWLPFAGIGIGIAVSALVSTGPAAPTVLAGIVYGLSAVGLYEGQKNVRKIVAE